MSGGRFTLRADMHARCSNGRCAGVVLGVCMAGGHVGTVDQQ